MDDASSNPSAIQDSPAAARFLLQGSDATLALAAAKLGLPCPASLNAAAGSSSGRAILQLGPDEWLIIAIGEDPARLAEDLLESIGRADASLVDISDRQSGLDLAGDGCALALNAHVPCDLSLAAFPVGASTRTIFAKAEIVVWRTDVDAFKVEVGRSFAAYVRALVQIALRENQAAP